MIAEYNENSLYERFPSLCECKNEIETVVSMMLDTYKKGGKILLCGNGGSCADCDHIVGELMKSFMYERKPDDEFVSKLCGVFGEETGKVAACLQTGIPAISLPSQTAVLSAYLNDVEPEYVYAQLVYGYAKENDMLIGLSTSGNSKNVVNAVKVAKAMGIRTASITGMMESKLSSLCDVCVRVPETETYKVQELTLPVYHHLCAFIEKTLFGGNEK